LSQSSAPARRPGLALDGPATGGVTQLFTGDCLVPRRHRQDLAATRWAPSGRISPNGANAVG